MVIALQVEHSFQMQIPQSVVDLTLLGIASAQRDTSSASLTGPPKCAVIISKQVETSLNKTGSNLIFSKASLINLESDWPEVM